MIWTRAEAATGLLACAVLFGAAFLQPDGAAPSAAASPAAPGPSRTETQVLERAALTAQSRPELLATFGQPRAYFLTHVAFRQALRRGDAEKALSYLSEDANDARARADMATRLAPILASAAWADETPGAELARIGYGVADAQARVFFADTPFWTRDGREGRLITRIAYDGRRYAVVGYELAGL